MQKNIHHDKVENKKQFMIIVTSFLNILFTKKNKKTSFSCFEMQKWIL
jgi:hypothetical protein